jgi:hypothetical protein
VWWNNLKNEAMPRFVLQRHRKKKIHQIVLWPNLSTPAQNYGQQRAKDES